MILFLKKIPPFFLVLIGFFAQAQTTTSPYKLDWKADAPVLGGGITFLLINQLVWEPSIKPMTEAQILALNPNDLWAIDRPTTLKYNKNSRTASDVLGLTAVAAPCLLLLDKNIQKDFGTVSTMYGQTLLMNYLVTDVTKQLVKRPRPFNYNPDVPMSEKLERDAQFSFFSGHTSTVAASSFFAAKVYSDYNPESPALPYVWTGAVLLPATVAYLRTDGGKHFPTDVIVGYLIGAGIGFLVPELHKIRLK